ncbi:MAG: bifunctional precorrin-2 dehydrogenase/sirohydrochlorin ferrochelatase [Defluviitaleaceae bacterium]|nr:bifunctional precorrin-2 dehydrogenase/sirohydrochlorin ferrochelatase [Defluviitaleaceae bacterium]
MKITVIGGGKIAFRKCRFFLDIKKRVTVVSRDFCADFEREGDNLTLICDSYKQEYIADSSIVIAATNDKKLNADIAGFCTKNNKMVNVASDFTLSTFIIPAHIRSGDLLISVSTEGKSPSLTAKIKRELEGVLKNRENKAEV